LVSKISPATGVIPEPMKKKIGSQNQSIPNVVLTTQIMKILPSHQPVSIE